MNVVDLSDYWNSGYVDAHRRGITDLDWAAMQPRGHPKYRTGDVVEFKVGGFGIIHEVCKQKNGWPNQYSTKDVHSLIGHPQTKAAWHYELDFKRRLFWRSLLRWRNQ